jgi:protein-S-isoprenylcysteine O-methyltransferase Ste14
MWVLTQNALTLAVLTLGPLTRGRWQDGWVAGGVALFLVGAGVGLAGVRALGGARSPYPQPRAEVQRMVVHGLYAVVRHPLYCSLMLLSLGWTLLWRSGPTLLATLALIVVLDAKARVEERWLRTRFPEYAAYARRVRRFIPKVY